MKKRVVAMLLTVCMIASSLAACGKREDEVPVVADTQNVEEPVVQEEATVMPLSWNGSYMAELTRLDGDNTEEASVESKEVSIVLKATSVQKDLKIKIVNEKNGKVITGQQFKVKVTDSKKNSKTYTDDDKDGIIYIKDMNAGSVTIAMEEAPGFKAPESIKAEVKDKIEYKPIDVTEEIKKESEVDVKNEDASYGTDGTSDAGGSSSKPKDTVEYVESTKTEIMEQKKDEFGTPMYEKIISEPDRFHVDSNKDLKCDRCGAAMKAEHVHKYEEVVVNATCGKDGEKYQQCKVEGCPEPIKDKTTIPATGQHTDADNNKKCDVCGAEITNHTHQFTVTKEATCTTVGEETCACGVKQDIPKKAHDLEETTAPTCYQSGTKSCKNCDYTETISATGNHVFDESGACTTSGCTAKKDVAPPDTSTDGNPSTPAEETASEGIVALLQDFFTVDAKAATQEKIVYDTTSAPIMVGTGKYKYTGWQTIDNITYYFDKDGNKVTGTQVIQGVQYTFNSNGERSGSIGIDVSKYQPNVNWSKVKNAGISFVMIRCGYRGYGSGVLVEDPKFASHIKGAKAAGLKVGVYFFSQAVNEAEAVEEASMALSLVNKYGGVNMPIAIDSEYANGGAGRADKLSKSERTKITQAFCNTIASGGYTPMVYASKSWFGSQLSASALSNYRIWVAQYADKCTYSGRYDIWQYTSKGSVSGISGNVDMNISYM